MDLEKVKKTYKWDPMRGDYSKSHVSYERRIQKRKQTISTIFKIFFILAIIAGVVIIYNTVK